MDNPQIAAIFDEIADYLELTGENLFRIRAYRNAARLLRSLPVQVSEILSDPEKKLEDLPGIGKDLSGKIKTILKTGKLPLHETLCRQIPKGLREIMTLPGLGPKKALRLYKELDLTSLDELKKAALEHRVRDLRGFGEKTESTISEAIETLKETRRRYTLAEAKAFADAIVNHLKKAPGLIDIEVAGSYRRRKETVGDLDILVACRESGAVMDRLGNYSRDQQVLARGKTKMTIRLRNGLQVDLRVVPKSSYGSALQYFTGSVSHSIALRQRAQARKLKLNEYGIFRGRRRIGGKTEEEIYRTLGLPWIPPELREGRDEVVLASKNALPNLISTQNIKGDLHMHTKETDGRSSLEEMVIACKCRGYKYIAITDHSKRVTVAHGLDAVRLKKQWKKIERLQAKERDIVILKGIELDILDDGTLDLPDAVLGEADWVIASLHYKQRQPKSQITHRLIRAIKHPAVKAIAHPTGRLIGRRAPYDFDLDAVMAAAADYGVALELNGQPDRLDLNDVLLRSAKEHGVRIVIDSDAHSIEELANMEFGVYQARRAGLEASDVVNTRSLEEFFGALKQAA